MRREKKCVPTGCPPELVWQRRQNKCASRCDSGEIWDTANKSCKVDESVELSPADTCNAKGGYNWGSWYEDEEESCLKTNCYED